jgi:iron complex outermembrane receptor protein
MLLPAAALAQTSMILEEVVVTAQKREQSLQDVPITLNAFNTEFLRVTGAQNLDNLQQFTPGLEATNLGVTQPTFSIRGIGTGGLSIGTDPAVGVYMDGVYVGRSASSNTEFSDIERVEILKGPQGTLFGRNAAAGAIQIITQKPSQEMEGFARVRVGNYDKLLGEAAVNVPLIDDTLSSRFNVIASRRDGYVDNYFGGDDLNDESYHAGRASFLWTPGDLTDIRYTFDYNRLDQDAPHAIGINPDLSVTGTPGGQTGDVDVFGPVANDVLVSEEKRKLYAHTLHIDHDLNWSTMSFVGSYRSFEANVRQDEDGLAQAPGLYLDTNNVEDNSQLYMELRFAGDSGPIQWVGGVSYYDEDGEQDAEVSTYVGSLVRNGYNALVGGWIIPDDATCLSLTPAVLSGSFACGDAWTETMSNKASTRSIAGFGDVTWQISDQFGLTVGLRYTRDEKDFEWYNAPNSLTGIASDDQIFSANASAESALAKTQTVTADDSWTNIDPRVVLNYYPTEDVMVFASYANGYTAGGFNSLQVGSNFDPEEVDNFELGIKSQWFDQSLRFNASVYRYYYSDKQDIQQLDDGSTIRKYVTVTGDAEGTGMEAEVTWLPVNGLQLGLNYGYLDAQWTDRVVGDIDLDGEPLDGPKQRVAFMLDYNWALGNSGDLQFHFDYSWTAALERNPVSADYAVEYETKDDPYQLSNARIAWIAPSTAWQVALWAENLFDTEHVVGYNGIAEDLNGPYVRRNRPRFFGAEVIYSW